METTDALGGQQVSVIFLPFVYFSISLFSGSFPMPTQAASQDNQPTVGVFEANNFERVESKKK